MIFEIPTLHPAIYDFVTCEIGEIGGCARTFAPTQESELFAAGYLHTLNPRHLESNQKIYPGMAPSEPAQNSPQIKIDPGVFIRSQGIVLISTLRGARAGAGASVILN